MVVEVEVEVVAMRPGQSVHSSPRSSSVQTLQLSDCRKQIFRPAGPEEWKLGNQILKLWFHSSSIFRK